MTLTISLQVITTIAALLAIAASLHSSRTNINSAKEIAIAQIEASKVQVSKEIAASVLSANLQAWINDLRNTIANFVVSVNQLHELSIASKEDKSSAQISRMTHESWLHLSRIRLLINKNEPNHESLLALTNDMLDSVRDTNLNVREIERKLIIKAQEVLQHEWEKVRALT